LVSRTLRYLFPVLAIGALLLACGNRADARPPFGRPYHSSTPPYSFTIEDESGNALPTFRQNGRTYLLGEAGQRYNIRVRNPTGQRVEAVVSVDGRDAISGEPGDYVRSRGYVIAPHDSMLIEGFRRSMEEVATFRFTSPENSYSARLGTPENVGVIGVAFFSERVPPPQRIARPMPRLPMPMRAPRYDYSSPSFEGDLGANDKPAQPSPSPKKMYAPAMPRASAPSNAGPSAAPSGAGASEDARDHAAAPAQRAAKGRTQDDYPSGSVNNLGTEFGETRESVIGSTSFDRASPAHPMLVATLRYDDADGLSARGIDLSSLGYYSRAPTNDNPEPFPRSHFAQPPP
jgi:hypothetical protein